jgi:hypothetical protein
MPSTGAARLLKPRLSVLCAEVGREGSVHRQVDIEGAGLRERPDDMSLRTRDSSGNRRLSVGRPRPSCETSAVRDLTRGKQITDIDAIGAQGTTLLFVSCKSMIYSKRYDMGDYAAVRNVSTMLVDAVDKWKKLAANLLATPGDNFVSPRSPT